MGNLCNNGLFNLPEIVLTLFLENNLLGRTILWQQAKKNVMKNTGGNYPAPLKILEVVKEGYSTTLERGLEIEARALAGLITTAEHKNLLHVFHLSERPKKQTGVEEVVELGQVQKIGVLGAGVMGGGIAQLLAYHDYRVRMKDIDKNMVAGGLAHAQSLFQQAARRHKIGKIDKERKLENISGTVHYDGFSRLDLVIEAVVENLNVKKKVMQEVEEVLPGDAVFACSAC